jgi:hypothetical protein
MSNDFDFGLAGYTPEDEGTEYTYASAYWLSTTRRPAADVGAWHTGAFETMPAPWVKVERFEGETGHEANDIEMVPIRRREFWVMNCTDDLSRYIPHYLDAISGKTFLTQRGFDPNLYRSVRSTVQVLAMVKGMDEPIVLQAKGMVGSHLFRRPTRRSPGGIVYQYVNAALGIAKATSTSAIPHYSFWVGIKAPRTAKGLIKTTEVGTGSSKAYVVMPELIENVDGMQRADIVKTFVGRDKQELFQAVYEESKAWSEEVRDDFATMPANAPTTPSAVRNVPEAIEDEASPF